jgi:hypothetical protein
LPPAMSVMTSLFTMALSKGVVTRPIKNRGLSDEGPRCQFAS